MFNLPFPTDSLYKFAFMFGLFLIVFSLYYKDSHLNKFNKKQAIYVLDSTVAKHRIDSLDNAYNIYLLNKLKRFEDVVLKLDYVSPSDSIDSFNKTFRLFIDIKFTNQNLNQRILSIYQSKIVDVKETKRITVEIEDDLTIKGIQLQNKFRRDVYYLKQEISECNIYFKLLLVVGIFLFLVGTTCWLLLIQLPQDKLLRLQLAEMKKKCSSTEDIAPDKS